MIRVSHLNKTFNQKNVRVEALRDVSLNIEKGSVYGVIGYSGAGKSTLVRCINLLERPTSGMVTVEDGRLFDYLRGLLDGDGIFIEPSACADFQGPVRLREMTRARELAGLTEERLRRATHIVWATGGSMVPEAERARCRVTGLA